MFTLQELCVHVTSHARAELWHVTHEKLRLEGWDKGGQRFSADGDLGLGALEEWASANTEGQEGGEKGNEMHDESS